MTALSENEVGREKYLLLTDEDIAEMVKPIGARRRLINLTKTDALDFVSHSLACMHTYGYMLMIKLATLHSQLCACKCVIQRNSNQQSGSHMDKYDYDDDHQWCSQVDLDFENSTLKVISSEDKVYISTLCILYSYLYLALLKTESPADSFEDSQLQESDFSLQLSQCKI